MVSHSRAVAAILVLLATAAPASAEVIHVRVTSRQPFADEVPDKAGRYERIRGRVVYALDPEHEANQGIVDLDLAAQNGEGRVEFYGDSRSSRPWTVRWRSPRCSTTSTTGADGGGACSRSSCGTAT